MPQSFISCIDIHLITKAPFTMFSLSLYFYYYSNAFLNRKYMYIVQNIQGIKTFTCPERLHSPLHPHTHLPQQLLSKFYMCPQRCYIHIQNKSFKIIIFAFFSLNNIFWTLFQALTYYLLILLMSAQYPIFFDVPYIIQPVLY